MLKKLTSETFKESWLESDNLADIEAYTAEYFSAARIKNDLSDNSVIYLYALYDGNIAGYLKLQKDAQPENSVLHKPVAIHRVYVMKKFQGNNIGNCLLEKAIELTKAAGYENIWLGVWKENHGAIRLYTRHGFEIFGMHKFIMGSTSSDDYLMKLSLGK